jgi:hypothetical protein
MSGKPKYCLVAGTPTQLLFVKGESVALLVAAELVVPHIFSADGKDMASFLGPFFPSTLFSEIYDVVFRLQKRPSIINRT